MVNNSHWRLDTRAPVSPADLRSALEMERDEYLKTNTPGDALVRTKVLNQMSSAIDAACTIAAGLDTHPKAKVLASIVGDVREHPYHRIWGRMSVSVDQVAEPPAGE